MGLIVGKFRVSCEYYTNCFLNIIVNTTLQKKKTTLDILENLEKDIKTIEDFRRNTEQAHKKIVGRFMLFSVLMYLLTAFIFYFYFFPATIYDRLFYIIPLIFAPVM